MRGLFEDIGVGMALVRPDGSFERVNGKLCSHLGYPAELLEKMNFQDITLSADLEEDLLGLEKVLSGESSGYTLEKRYISQGGGETWGRLSVRAQRDAKGNLERFVSTVVDIDDLKRREDKLRQWAMTDALTQVMTRRAFERSAKLTLEKALRRGLMLGVWMADVDGLKTINDTAGHAVGDAILSEIGKRLTSICGEDAYVARLGGDEFAILTRGDVRAGFGQSFERRLRGAMDVRCICHDRAYRVAISLGQAVFPNDGTTLDSLLLKADRQMYRQKRLRSSS